MPVAINTHAPVSDAGTGAAGYGNNRGALMSSGVLNNGGLVLSNQPSQADIYYPGNPYGNRYRPLYRNTVKQTWSGDVLNQTAPYTVYQELGTVVDILDLSGTALAAGYIAVVPPTGFLQDLVELTRTKLGGNTFGSLQIPIPAGLWTFLIQTTTAGKVLKFSHYGFTN